MKFAFALLALFMLVFLSSHSYAEQTYAQSFNSKFQRGAVNGLLGWSKFFTVPYEKSSEDPNAWATLGRGIYEGLGGTVAGIFNIVFSPTPLREMPYPGGGVFES